MKRIGVAFVLAVLLLATTSSGWAEVIVKNTLDKPVVVKLASGASVQIRPRGRATLGDDDAKSAEVQRLVQQGVLEVVKRPGKPLRKPSKGPPAERKPR